MRTLRAICRCIGKIFVDSMLREKIRLFTGKVLTAVFFTVIVISTSLTAQAYQIPPNLTPGERAMPFYTGEVLPTPQKAKYLDEQLPLSRAVILVGSNVSHSKAYIALLSDRIKLHGGHLNEASSIADAPKGATVIVLGRTKINDALHLPDVPDHSEAYILQARQTNGHHVVVLEATDRTGLLWAVISFNQLVSEQHGDAYVRAANIVDYPYTSGRGYLLNPWWGTGSEWAWFCLQFKINKVVFPGGNILQHRLAPSGNHNWRQKPDPKWLNQLNRIGRVLNPFGIEWYVGLRPINGKPQQKVHSGSEKDFNALYNVFAHVAAAGGNIMLSYDDTRFPISPADKKQFGKASKADVYLINKLYDKIQKNYPGTKMLFVPPYYMGPASNPHYPEENRKSYLTRIGNDLPKSIGIFWTGPRVGTSKMTKSAYNWITNYIHRKPWYWRNNRFGSVFHHMYHGYYYVGDSLYVFKKLYPDPSIFKQFVATCMNSNGASVSVPEAALMEYLWHPTAFDPVQTPEVAAKKIAGPKAYPALVKLNHAMRKLDPYHASVTPAAVRNVDQIRKDMTAVNEALKQALSASPDAVPFWTPMEHFVKLDSKMVRNVEKRVASGGLSKKVRKAVADIGARAKQEVDFNQKTEILLSPYDFIGGTRVHHHFAGAPPRYATWITNHKDGEDTSLSVTFQLNHKPRNSYQLVLSGRAFARHVQNGEHNCPIVVTINHHTVYKGMTRFNKSTHHWSQGALPPFSAKYLREGRNHLTIKNTAPAHGLFMVNYAVIRPSNQNPE
jgi:hypothetical protein